LAACGAGIRKDMLKSPSEALPPAQDTPTAAYVEAKQAVHPPGQSGFRLLTLNTNALLSRVVLADHAEHSVDLQTYIFENDDTGRLVAEALLRAADRGVRVRLLVDDITRKHDSARLLDALDAHANIEVRVFNPFSTRLPGTLSKSAQMLLDFRRLNRRMHNKSFIVDNKFAVIGGRNIGNEYFDANADGNYRDLDLLAIGPVVEQASAAFDTYWNNEASLPASAWTDAKSSPADLVKVRATLDRHVRAFADSDYAKAALQELPDGPTADRQGQWFWGAAVMAADQPEKIASDADQPELRIGPKVKQLMYGASAELLVLSPYFIPSQPDREALVALAKRQVVVRIATNSLAATDQPPVHSAYGPTRRQLLAGGVQLYELKPRAEVTQTDAQDASIGVSLHAKSFVVDSRYVFVGSMNMDQRSSLLNTEQGIVVDSPALAQAVAQFFTSVTQPANAWRLALEDKDGKGADGQILWTSEKDGKSETLDHEPEVGVMMRGEVLLLKLLPIDGLL
ncbi:MAG: phospholipase D family protein, partial [Arenimonas sp.]